MKETRLPDREAFYNSLGVGQDISTDEHERAKEVWKKFRIKNMREYTEHYCLLDVYLLAESFTEFCRIAHRTFGIWPTHHNTLPR